MFERSIRLVKKKTYDRRNTDKIFQLFLLLSPQLLPKQRAYLFDGVKL